jgi:uncharacterized protein (TIGR00725 family)
MDETVISVFGSGRVRPGAPAYVLAEQAGRALAQAGFAVANGGYGGSMRASAQGAAGAGGTVIGVTCSAFRATANEYVTREIVTASLEERLGTLVRLGRAYLALPGGTGTLLEVAMVWELKNKGFLEAGRPIVLLGDFWRPLVEMVAADDPRCLKHVTFAAGPDEAVEMIRQALGAW